jgi:hypothetical protein
VILSEVGSKDDSKVSFLEKGKKEENWSGRENWTPLNRKNVGSKAHAVKMNMRYLVSLRRAIQT